MDTPLPPRVILFIGHSVARIEYVVVVHEYGARPTELRPHLQAFPVLVEDLRPVVASICHDDPALMVHRNTVRIVEAARISTEGFRATAYLKKVGTVARKFDDAIIAAAVPVRDPDVPIGSDHHVGGSVEMSPVGTGNSPLAQSHHHLSGLVELDDLVSEAPLRSFYQSSVADRGALGELNDHRDFSWERHELLGSAEILIIPGMTNFFRPSTKPTFRETELAAIRAGQPVTKVVLAGDYAKSIEKLRRLVDLQSDLQRSRKVFVAEVKRLEARHRYYRMTDHLYNHGAKFVQNEQQMQKARGMMSKIDRQLDTQRRRCQALQFVVGMFAPDEAMAVFSKQQAELNRDRTVLVEQKHQIDLKFNNAPRGIDFSSN